MNIKPDTSIISGTHSPQDLIPAFMGTLRKVAPAEYEAFAVQQFGPVPAYAEEDRSSEWWDGDAAQDLIGELIELLDAEAPEGYYFGSHPGDGSDYGFWKCEEDEVFGPDVIEQINAIKPYGSDKQ